MCTQLTCENVSLGYEGNVITKNLNFSVKRGDYLCVVGENGSGKSTLIKTLLQLKSPISGKLHLEMDFCKGRLDICRSKQNCKRTSLLQQWK